MRPQLISVGEWNKLKTFFGSEHGSLPFDIFSAAFYLVTRYEEYFSHEWDEHKRFSYTNSLAFKNHFFR